MLARVPRPDLCYGSTDQVGDERNVTLLGVHTEVCPHGPESCPELFATREEQLAYYINAYNAMVFDGVLDRGPEEESVWK